MFEGNSILFFSRLVLCLLPKFLLIVCVMLLSCVLTSFFFLSSLLFSFSSLFSSLIMILLHYTFLFSSPIMILLHYTFHDDSWQDLFELVSHLRPKESAKSIFGITNKEVETWTSLSEFTHVRSPNRVTVLRLEVCFPFCSFIPK